MLYMINIGGLPIFHLDSSVQGITDMGHAAKISREVTNIPGATVTVMEVDADGHGGKCETFYAFWHDNVDECSKWRALDAAYETTPDSPLHHDNRCQSH